VDAVDTSPDLGSQNVLATFEMAIRHDRRPDDTNGTRERFLSLDLFSHTFKNIFLAPFRRERGRLPPPRPPMDPPLVDEGCRSQWRRQDFVTGGESEVWIYRGSSVRSPPVSVVLSVYQRGSLLDGLAIYRGICRVIRRSSMTMKVHTYYIIFGRPPIAR